MLTLETHYYDGGLKVEAFDVSGRMPATVPLDSVILPTSFSLGLSEILYSIQWLQKKDSTPALWIGCYIKSVDRQVGDRENYVAVGLWLSDGVLLGAAEFLMLMFEGARRLHKEGMTEALQEAFVRLAKIGEQFVVPRIDIPPIFGGISMKPWTNTARLECELTGSVVEFIATLDCALVNLQLAPEPFADARGVFFFSCGDSPKRAGLSVLPSREELLMPVVTSLPNLVQETTKQLIDTREQLCAVLRERDSLKAEVKKLISELTGLQKEYGTVIEENKRLRDDVAALRRLPYVTIDELSKNIKSQLERIETKISVSSTVEKPRKIKNPSVKGEDTDPMMSLVKWMTIVLALLVVGLGGGWLLAPHIHGLFSGLG